MPGDFSLARGAAAQMRLVLAQGLLTMPGYFLLFTPATIESLRGLITLLFWVCMSGLAVATIMTIRQFRATGRFLETGHLPSTSRTS